MALFLLGVNLSAAEVLTNESIISMVKAGLGDQLIISKIKTTQNQFDLSTEKILKLKRSGVSENVIKTMIEVSSSGSMPHKKTAVRSGFPMTSFMTSRIYTKTGGKTIELVPIMPEVKRSLKKNFIPFYFGKGDIWYYMKGKGQL